MVKPLAAGLIIKPLIVLFVKFSTPSKVANTPVVGKVKLVVAVVFKVTSDAFETVVPVVVKFFPVLILPPSVIVLPVLLIPVPPLTPATMPVTLVEVPTKLAVMVPAAKLPLASLLTIALFVLVLLAPLANNSAA